MSAKTRESILAIFYGVVAIFAGLLLLGGLVRLINWIAS